MKYAIIILAMLCYEAGAQSGRQHQQNYNAAFNELKGMLTDSIPLSFKRAVFVTENAYVDNQIDYQKFCSQLRWLADRALLISAQSNLAYNESDRERVQKYAAIFRLMTDTTRFYQDSVRYYETLPYRYDFHDFWGEKDWRKMFVTKLLQTNSGNCHSMPFLYKMLCEELGEKAYLAMAPNHTYIKLKCKKLGWYNTELTSGNFPIDAWIMASGYIPLVAVQNRIYMDTLSAKQSVAVCLIDLAKGYEKKFGDYADPGFIIRSCDMALRYYPNYVNGLLLKAETLKKRFEKMMTTHGAEYPADLFQVAEAKTLFDTMQGIYVQVHASGYRKMPHDMYLRWLSDLNKEKEKYTNQAVQAINTKN